MVIPAIILAKVLSNRNEQVAVVQVGDTVKIHYKLWIADSEGNKVSLRDDNEDFEITLKSTAKETGLIYGFYDAILGMKNGSIKSYVFLPACVDDLPDGDPDKDPNAVNGDGWDDRYPPGEVRCLSYGTGELRNTPLIFWIQILNITKGTTS